MSTVVWRLKTPACCFSCVAPTPDGRYVIAGTYTSDPEHGVSVFQATGGGYGEVCRFKAHTGVVSSISVTHDGRHVLSGSHDRTLRLWSLDEETTEIWMRKYQKVDGYPSKTIITPDGSRVVVITSLGSLSVLSVEGNGELLWERPYFSGMYAVTAAIASDGIRVVISGIDETLRVWSLDEGEEKTKFKYSSGCWRTHDVAFSSDGRYITSCGVGKTLRMWNLDMAITQACSYDNGVGELVYDAHRAKVTPDGRYAVSSGRSGASRICSLLTGELLAEIPDVELALDPRQDIGASQDGQRIVAKCADHSIVVLSTPLRLAHEELEDLYRLQEVAREGGEEEKEEEEEKEYDMGLIEMTTSAFLLESARIAINGAERFY